MSTKYTNIYTCFSIIMFSLSILICVCCEVCIMFHII